MSIKIEILDPHTESPQALRTIAHFLNCLAADREGNPQQYSVTLQPGVTLQQTAAPITQETLPANPGNDLAAPGASTDLTQTSGANASGGDTVLDKNGLPWDPRIHSSSKNLNKDETWRYVRISKEEDKPAFEALKLQVEAELRERMAAAGNGQADAPTNTQSAETGAAATQQLAPAGETPPPPPPIVTPGADVPPPPPPINPDATDAPEEPAAVDFKQVFARVTALQKHASGNLLPTELLTQVLELAEVTPPTMAGFMQPANKVKAPAVLDAINALVEGA